MNFHVLPIIISILFTLATCKGECVSESDCLDYAKCNKTQQCECKFGPGTYDDSDGITLKECPPECNSTSKCPERSKCNSSNICECKYGEKVRIPDGKLVLCNYECVYNSDCLALGLRYAKCNDTQMCECIFGPGNFESDGETLKDCPPECSSLLNCTENSICDDESKCKCLYGGGYNDNGRLKGCDPEPFKCTSDSDCVSDAECSGGKCSCKYGGGVSSLDGRKVFLCDPNYPAIIGGVVGGVLVVSVIVIVSVILIRRNRLRRMQQQRAAFASAQANYNQTAPTSPMYQAGTYPSQQYQSVAPGPPPPNQGQVK